MFKNNCYLKERPKTFIEPKKIHSSVCIILDFVLYSQCIPYRTHVEDFFNKCELGGLHGQRYIMPINLIGLFIGRHRGIKHCKQVYTYMM